MSELPQGDIRLLTHPTAQRLLESTELARLAYIVKDGTPRVLPMLFDWTDGAIVFGAYANSHKLASLRAHRRYYGDEQGAANVAGVREQGVRRSRIVVRPSWVGVLDFQTRLPGAIRQ